MEVVSRLKKARRLLVTALLLVALVGGPFSTPLPAQAAAEFCPIGSASPHISTWSEVHRQKGVTHCVGTDWLGFTVAHVQIVDFASGAKMRVMSEVASGSTPGLASTSFNKRTALEWFNWIHGQPATQPNPSLMYSTTSSAFFNNTNPNPPHVTTLSFPQKKWNTLQTPGASPDTYDKRVFGLSNPTLTPQQGYLMEFPYKGNVPATVDFYLTNFFDATVQLHPLSYADGQFSTDRRNVLGARRFDGGWHGAQDRVYILSTQKGMTHDDARNILVNDFGTQWNMTLDGGNSTQMWTQSGWRLDSGLCLVPGFGCRKVPEVIAIYHAP